MREHIRFFLEDLLRDLAAADTNLVLLVVLIVCSVIVLDAVTTRARKRRKETGMDVRGTTVSIDGGKTLPVRHYVSEMQGLAGRPDALISENGCIIPVERKPLSRKLHDRHVAQLLVYMRLIEEFEGKKPPYGYLVLGPSCRTVKIENTSARQAWLQSILNEMHSVIQGAAARPEPFRAKCCKCDVREHCQYRADITPTVKINTKAG